ncbi:MAG: hypothetical protein NC123_12755 [Butyrivibrio sp.]|nr:hypothetical protein [Acetatifactor muris]MCM1560390.1 hypothetical protein [Butyrivibrio sp.]
MASEQRTESMERCLHVRTVKPGQRFPAARLRQVPPVTADRVRAFPHG